MYLTQTPLRVNYKKINGMLVKMLGYDQQQTFG